MSAPSRAVAVQPVGALSELARTLARPAVAGTIAALLLVVGIRGGPHGRTLLEGFFLAALVVLAAIDLERRVVPNRIVLPAALVVLCGQAAVSTSEAPKALLAAVGAFVILLLPAVVRPGALGMGDVKLGLLLGAGLGGSVLAGLLVGFLALVPVALFLLVSRGGAARTTALPLAPFLAFGAAVVVLAGLPA